MCGWESDTVWERVSQLCPWLVLLTRLHSLLVRLPERPPGTLTSGVETQRCLLILLGQEKYERSKGIRALGFARGPIVLLGSASGELRPLQVETSVSESGNSES